MRLILIETCTERGVIAFVDHNQILYQKELPFGITQSRFLIPFLDEMFQAFEYPPSSLDLIGVGVGPGSYTGIRVGVAAAQALAYAWNVPLIGISTLNGFIPLETEISFASIIDARIGGVYLRRGRVDSLGTIHYESEPQVFTLEEAAVQLEGVSHLVTPNCKSLQEKFQLFYPGKVWKWVESAPCVKALVSALMESSRKGFSVRPPEHLELLYLRKTEAERNREK